MNKTRQVVKNTSIKMSFKLDSATIWHIQGMTSQDFIKQVVLHGLYRRGEVYPSFGLCDIIHSVCKDIGQHAGEMALTVSVGTHDGDITCQAEVAGIVMWEGKRDANK